MNIGIGALSRPTLAASGLFACVVSCHVAGALLGPAITLTAMPAPVGPAVAYVGATIDLAPPGPCPGTPCFSGTWSAPAGASWQGVTIAGSGSYPSTSAGLSASSWLFMGSDLPAGTLFLFSDVDNGSSHSEVFTLRAFDHVGQITTPWLDEPVDIPGFSPTSTQLPKWKLPDATVDFASCGGSTPSTSCGMYTIDGNSVPGNPLELFALVSDRPIHQLIITKSDTSFGFGLGAPVGLPEPAPLALIGVALAGLTVVGRRKH
jgi:hypothetical protein